MRRLNMGKWHFTYEPDHNGKAKWQCHKCNNNGLIPSLEFEATPWGRTLKEVMYECDCLCKKEFWYKDPYTDARTKISQPYAVKYGYGFQFPFTEAIMNSRNPKIDYHEVCQVYRYKFLKKYPEDRNAVLDTDIEILREYVKSPIKPIDFKVELIQ